MSGNAEDWRNIALYLASCHAATYEDQRDIKSIAKSRRERLRGICKSALRMIETEYYFERSQNYEHVVKRLRDALSPPPPSGEGGK